MQIIIVLLQKYWKQLLVVALIAIPVLYVMNLKDTIRDQEQQITKLKDENTILQTNVSTLQQAVATSNKAVDKLSDAASVTKRNFATLNSSISYQTDQLAAKLQDIMQSGRPITCGDTIQYLIDANKGYPK